MGVWVTGDTHADWMPRFNTKNFKDQKEMTRDDFVIICGDFGLWHNDGTERNHLKWLNDKPWTTVWVDGNHENYDRIYSNEFPIVDFHGGKAHKIRDNIYHLMRGYVFDFCGKKFFSFGGASSHDIQDGILDPCDFEDSKEFARTYAKMYAEGKFFRVNHLSWWKEELPSQEEMERGKHILAQHDYKVDYVITHCLPQQIASIAGYRNPDTATIYFNSLLEDGIDFKEWFCGHYHRNDRIMGKYQILYEQIIRIC